MPKGIYYRPLPIERFNKYCSVQGDCILWTAGKDKDGYGNKKNTILYSKGKRKYRNYRICRKKYMKFYMQLRRKSA